MNENQKQKKLDVYAFVTERITKQLEQGVIPWSKSFSEAGLPQNIVTKRPYRGINVWLLNLLHYPKNYFITSNQLKELGGVAKAEEKGTLVTFWNWKDITDDQSGETRKVAFLRYYYVYNVDQCDGIPDEYVHDPLGKNKNPLVKCEQIISEMQQKPIIKHKEKKSYYDPCLDFINVPKINQFESPEHYYTALFHQLVHSTGHVTRLHRKEIMQMAELWADEPFSVEELIAEMGTGYLKSLCGFTSDGKSKNDAVKNGWLEKLKENKQLVIYAASKAQLAVDCILNISFKDKAIEQVGEVIAEHEEAPF